LEKETEFELFFKENYSRFYYFAFQIIGEKEVCRDIVSDAFEQAWSFFHQKEQFNLIGYMYSLVRNKCVDYLRHEMAKARYADFYVYMYSESDEDNIYEEMEQQISKMYSMLDKFTPKTRIILEMCYFQKKTYKETAGELGISVSAVRKHIVTALKAFRAEFAKKNE